MKVARFFGLAAAYFLTGKLGTLLALSPGFATPVWPPSGIALAGLLILGYRYWPAVWLGSLLVNLPTTLHSSASPALWESLIVTSFIGGGAAAQAAFGAFLIRRRIRFPNPLEEERDIVTFMLLGGPVSCVVNATVAVTTLWMAGIIPAAHYPINWGTWWIGDSIGVIVVAPLILMSWAAPGQTAGFRRQVIAILLMGFMFALVIWLFVVSNIRQQKEASLSFGQKNSLFSRTLKLKLENTAFQEKLVLLAGLSFTGLLGAFLLAANRRAARIEALVNQRTASLEASESRFRAVIQSVFDAIISADDHSKIVGWNGGAERIFGYGEEEVRGRPLTILMPPKHRQAHSEGMKRFLETGESKILGKTVELTGLRKNGTEFPLELTATQWKAGNRTFFTGILRDITERKKIDQMKTDFVSFASHQLKTPLAEIQGFVENLFSGLGGTLSEKQRRYLSLIKGASESSAQLVSDLLNISKVEQGMMPVDLKPAALNEIANRAAEEYRERIGHKGLEFAVSLSPADITVMADADKAVEAVKNVLDNAAKFTEKGAITLETKSGGGRGILEISDTGKGMDQSLLDCLFTKELVLQGAAAKGGSGLGLYIAKSFMKLQGGDVTVQSEPGCGSTFTFVFRRIP